MEEYISLIKNIIIEAQQGITMRIYLETSVINFLFNKDAPEKMKSTQEFFNLIDEYEVFISDIVLLEMNKLQNRRKIC